MGNFSSAQKKKVILPKKKIVEGEQATKNTDYLIEVKQNLKRIRFITSNFQIFPRDFLRWLEWSGEIQ